MQTYMCRCKICNQTYWYNTYGNEDERTDEYCPDCAKIINSIPKKFEPRWKEIDEPHLLELFQRIEQSEKEKEEKIQKEIEEGKREKPILPKMVPLLMCSWGPWENCVEIHHNGIHYRMYWNDDTPDQREFRIEMEYDLTKKEFTSEPWKHYEKGGFKDYYHHQHSPKKKYFDPIQEIRMSEPMGWIPFLDMGVKPDWTGPVDDRPNPHALRTYIRTLSGAGVRNMVKEGRYCYSGKVDILVGEGVSIDSLVDFLQYECTLEYRDDDRTRETLKSIKIK